MGCGPSNNNNNGGSAETPSDAPNKNVPHTFNARYTLGDVLGEGAFSVVKLATSKVTKNQKVAVKIVSKQGLSEVDELSLKQEVAILKDLKHPNIVHQVDFFETDSQFLICLEYLEGGELFDRIVSKTFYSEREARDVVYTLLSAIQYCHNRDIVHRDLKPENLLLASLEDDAAIKLADFGFAAKAVGNSLRTQCGTPGYVAPEILCDKPHGKPVDMWSIGVITYILLGGYPPFHDENQKNLFRLIKAARYEFHPEYWGNVSEEAKDLIRHLLTLDVSKRYTVKQALEHPWVTRHSDELGSRNLGSNLKTLRRYNARRKLRAGIKAVMAANRMKAMLNDFKEINAKKRMNNENKKDDQTRGVAKTPNKHNR
eukprot:TRINITY_DN46439_c0_g1_i1.p1 TRINITY_DN46439_c0_g1~~TRINITY_DN46439_c0_g1_i1.p1  ORF type:complete len:371 (+),score=-14.88 TRINITY_DN46439_c0_g1_i1:60-1172(+)